nr:peroxiredoxin-like family protein [uncultured Bacteroides sp.]
MKTVKSIIIVSFMLIGLSVSAQNPEKALKVGDKAPMFELTNSVSKKVSLEKLLKKGPVVLVWYRGGWCPYCNLALNKLQEALPDMKKLKTQLVAITPEVPDSSFTTKERNNLKFEVLSDINNQVGRKYGLVYKLSPDVEKMYESKFGLSQYNGNKNAELPMPATYVIDKEGIIRYAFVDADYKKRADPSEVIKALRELK